MVTWTRSGSKGFPGLFFFLAAAPAGDEQQAEVHESILLKQRLTSEQSQFSLLADDLYVGLLLPASVAG